VKRVEIPKPDGGVRKLASRQCWTGLSSSVQQVSTEAVGPDVFRTQLRFSTGAVGPPGGGTGAAVYRRRLRWCVDFDLEKFFDRVNHDKLMGAVAKRVGDNGC